MAVDWTKFNYKREVQIDLGSLEIDNKDQSELIMKYGEERTRIGKIIKLQKEKISISRAKITKQMTSDLGKKPTVAEVDTECALDTGHAKLISDLIDLEYDYDLLGTAIKSFESRGYSLQEERSLLAMGYWSGMSKTNGVRKAMEEKRSEVDEKARETVNRKRRNKNNN
jgi:hypothetical protein